MGFWRRCQKYESTASVKAVIGRDLLVGTIARDQRKMRANRRRAGDDAHTDKALEWDVPEHKRLKGEWAKEKDNFGSEHNRRECEQHNRAFNGTLGRT